MDPSNTFLLNRFGYPEIVLVSKLLNEDNYDTWSSLMSIALSVKNKTVGFFYGSIQKSLSNDEKYFLERM